MKLLHLTLLSVLLFFCFAAKAEDSVYERVYVHTDKDCYIAGEDILLKFYVIDNHFQPSTLSKVGYVEICNTDKPLMQLKVALDEKGGAGKIEIPRDIPSGIYRLSGYTRYMRNEGEKVFFRKQIAIVNPTQQAPDPKRFELVEKYETVYSEKKVPSGLIIKTDQNEYGNRRKVVLSIGNIPANTADLVISVCRNDSIASVPEINNQEWLKQVPETLPFSKQWVPEYEGHIITGHFVPKPQEELLPVAALVGNDIRCFFGQENPEDETVYFYTAGIFGKQQIVTSAISPAYFEKTPYRIDLLTPFCNLVADTLPVLQIYPNERQLKDRYMGVQVQGKINSDSLNNPVQAKNNNAFQPVLSYDLDEYTRFATLSETILEFVGKVRVVTVRGKQTISVFSMEMQRFSPKTLVLLDGIPVYDHEDILKYNPALIKRIDIYDERYMFDGRDFECVISFITKEGNLPYFQLSDESQLFNYDFPQLPQQLNTPDYSTGVVKNSKIPDFRHTLYWNPFVEFAGGQPVTLSFYTSDLCGEFKVTVEGITTDGEVIRGDSYFQVK